MTNDDDTYVNCSMNIKKLHIEKFQNVCSNLYTKPMISSLLYNKINIEKNVLNISICTWLKLEIDKIFVKYSEKSSINTRLVPSISGFLFTIINTVIFPIIGTNMNLNPIDLSISELICTKYIKNSTEYIKTSQFIFNILIYDSKNIGEDMIYDLYPNTIFNINIGDLLIYSSLHNYNTISNSKSDKYMLTGYVDYLGGL